MSAARPREPKAPVGLMGPEFDDSRTAYVRGGVVTTRYRGQLYAMSDVACATRLHPPAALPSDGQPGPGHLCGHPLHSHARPESATGLWGRCGRCACQGHDPGFPTDAPVWCRYCSRDLAPTDAVERLNRRGGKFYLCLECS
jgi:hypothetical protein